MQLAYRRYCQAGAVAFVVVTLYTVPTKLLQGRLGDDWAHSVLHVGSAVLNRLRRLVHPRAAARHPLAIPLGVPEDLFHLLLSIPALAFIMLQLRSARSQIPGRR
jgi:hypothetical protein